MNTTNKTTIYKNALNDTEIFPPKDYHIHEIYDIIDKNVDIPQSHFENRPDVSFPIWKNYIHSVLPKLERVESLKPYDKREWHRFS